MATIGLEYPCPLPTGVAGTAVVLDLVTGAGAKPKNQSVTMDEMMAVMQRQQEQEQISLMQMQNSLLQARNQFRQHVMVRSMFLRLFLSQLRLGGYVHRLPRRRAQAHVLQDYEPRRLSVKYGVTQTLI